MDLDPFWLIVLFFFFFGPLIERVLRGGRPRQQRGPPPNQRPQQRQSPRRFETDAPGGREESGSGRSGREIPGHETAGDVASERARAQREGRDDSAAEMLPEDFWRILTGEAPRPGGPVEAPPRPAERKPERGHFEVEPMGPKLEPLPTGRRRVERQPERYEPPPPEIIADEETVAAERARKHREETRRRYAPPAVVSLEREIAPESIRHQRFHDRLESLAPPPGRRRTAPGPLPIGQLRGRKALRQAILMQEILGTPKGLEEGE